MARYQTDSPVVKAALGVYIGYMQGSIALTRVAEGLSELNLTPKLFGRTAMIAHQIMKGETVDLTDGAVPDDFPSFTFQSVAAAGTVLALCEFPEDEIKSSGREFAESDVIMETADIVCMIETINLSLGLGEVVAAFMNKPQMADTLEEHGFAEITSREAEARQMENLDDGLMDSYMDVAMNRGDVTETA